jgi:isoleucyl-tRNA synthetase
MKDVAGKISALSHSEIREILGGKEWMLGETTITAPDLILVREVSPDLAVTATADLTVALDVAIDEPLRLEMLARELVSRIQNLRKESGLAVTDRVLVRLDGVSGQLRQAVESHLGYISAEVLAAAVLFDGAAEGASSDMDVEGEKARIFVRKAD